MTEELIKSAAGVRMVQETPSIIFLKAWWMAWLLPLTIVGYFICYRQSMIPLRANLEKYSDRGVFSIHLASFTEQIPLALSGPSPSTIIHLQSPILGHYEG